MNDIVIAARTAREKLSSALAALQSPGADHLIDTVAPPVAAAMGALHAIETSAGAELPSAGPAALAGVRQALEALQLAPAENPIVDAATASVAGSLGLVFELAESAARAPAAVATETASRGTAPPSSRRADPLAQTYVAPHDLAVTTPAAPRPLRSEARASTPAEPPPGALQVEAALGVHSASNFYRGLSGDDVVEDGGIFIATYDVPRVGQELWICVSLPGGYQFQALGQVVWSREHGGGDASPGFGARFHDLSSEARQLVSRYVRNREPLFHDP